jgi:hypothetical protein
MLRYTPGGRVIKQPRACTKIWKTKNGNYLLWFHNNGTTTYNNGLNSGSRNIAWLSGGRLREGMMHWSQPEIACYVDGGLEGCSYPDLVESDGRFYICATQKTEARLIDVERDLINGLWQQQTNAVVTTNRLLFHWSGAERSRNAVLRAPKLAPLCGDIQRRKADATAEGFSIECATRFSDVEPGQIICDTRDETARGYVLRTGERGALHFEMSDGWQAAFWESDSGSLKANTVHHVVLNVDAGAKAITWVIDGELCDGGSQRQFGFGRFNPTFKDVSGRDLRMAPDLHGELFQLRIHGRALRTSEAIGNYHSFVKTHLK